MAPPNILARNIFLLILLAISGLDAAPAGNSLKQAIANGKKLFEKAAARLIKRDTSPTDTYTDTWTDTTWTDTTWTETTWTDTTWTETAYTETWTSTWDSVSIDMPITEQTSWYSETSLVPTEETTYYTEWTYTSGETTYIEETSYTEITIETMSPTFSPTFSPSGPTASPSPEETWPTYYEETTTTMEEETSAYTIFEPSVYTPPPQSSPSLPPTTTPPPPPTTTEPPPPTTTEPPPPTTTEPPPPTTTEPPSPTTTEPPPPTTTEPPPPTTTEPPPPTTTEPPPPTTTEPPPPTTTEPPPPTTTLPSPPPTTSLPPPPPTTTAPPPPPTSPSYPPFTTTVKPTTRVPTTTKEPPKPSPMPTGLDACDNTLNYFYLAGNCKAVASYYEWMEEGQSLALIPAGITTNQIRGFCSTLPGCLGGKIPKVVKKIYDECKECRADYHQIIFLAETARTWYLLCQRDQNGYYIGDILSWATSYFRTTVFLTPDALERLQPIKPRVCSGQAVSPKVTKAVKLWLEIASEALNNTPLINSADEVLTTYNRLTRGLNTLCGSGPALPPASSPGLNNPFPLVGFP